MNKNPTTLTISTPEEIRTVDDVETWWRSGPDLMVRFVNDREVLFPLGEIIE